MLKMIPEITFHDTWLNVGDTMWELQMVILMASARLYVRSFLESSSLNRTSTEDNKADDRDQHINQTSVSIKCRKKFIKVVLNAVFVR